MDKDVHETPGTVSQKPPAVVESFSDGLDSSAEQENDAYKQRPKEKELSSLDRRLSLGSQASEEERKTFCTAKIQSSLVLCCGFLCFGASMAVIGPTVLELGCLIGSNVGNMSWVFFAQTFSALIGAICSGVITDRFAVNYNVYLASVMTIHAIALALLSFMRTLGSLLVLTALHGLFGGFQDTATNLRMIIMHGQEVPPYLQTLFFFYGVGAFLSPIIAGNFLNEKCNQGDTSKLNEIAFSRRRRHNGIGVQHWHSMMPSDWTVDLSANQTISENEITKIDTTKIHYAYWIISLLHIVVTFALWYLYFAEKKKRELLRQSTLSLEQSTAGSDHDAASISAGSMQGDDTVSSARSEIDPSVKSQVILITVWIAMMVFISDGLQGSFGSYIYTYAMKSGIGIETDNAAYLNSLFWGSLALGRLLAIFVSIFVSPKVMLLFDIVGCLSSVLVMFFLRHNAMSLWIGTATFGLCLSNIFPTSVSMAESYFRLTGTITCIFVVCSGLGEMTIPLIIGKLFDVIGPVSFLCISCILCFMAVGIYTAVIITGRGLVRKQAELELRSTSVETLHDQISANNEPNDKDEDSVVEEESQGEKDLDPVTPETVQKK